MNRILASVSAALFAVTAGAQCFSVASPGTLVGIGDDTFFTPHYPLGFAFPMAGSALGSYTHFRVSCNGWLILTDGVTTPAGYPTSLSGTAAELTGGTAGYPPRIAPFWRDLNILAANSAGVYVDNTTAPGVSCRISWVNAIDYGTAGPTKNIQAELFVTGEVKFSYSSSTNVVGAAAAITGVSCANGVALPAASDLSAGSVSAAGCAFESFAMGTFDLSSKQILFVPAGATWVEVVSCQEAYHKAYGAGCYNLTSASETVYERFATQAAASAALQGNAVTLVPNGGGYTAIWLAGGAAGYLAPTGGATSLATTDDGATVITPSAPLPAPGSVATQLTVSHNGILTLGTVANQGTDYTPTGAELATSTGAAFYNWYDYNDTEVGSGTIKTEESGGVLYVTWDNVEAFDYPATANPSTVQFQLNLSTGVVTIVWQAVNAGGTAGREHIVGYSGPGASTDPGSTTLATALPFLVNHNPRNLALSASPPPKNDGVTGTTVTYTISNIPEMVPSSGIYIATLFLSVAPLPGVDLGFLGAPGCLAHIASLDLNVGVGSPLSAVQTGAVFYPPGALIPAGTDIWCQAVALFDTGFPGPYAGTGNTFGLLTSNGVQSHVEAN